MSLQDVLVMAYMNALQGELSDRLYSSEFNRIMKPITI